MSAGCWVGAPTRYSRKSPLGDRGLVERKAGQYGACLSTPGRVQRGRLLLSSPGEEGEKQEEKENRKRKSFSVGAAAFWPYSRKSPLGDIGLEERKAEQYGACPSTFATVPGGRLPFGLACAVCSGRLVLSRPSPRRGAMNLGVLAGGWESQRDIPGNLL